VGSKFAQASQAVAGLIVDANNNTTTAAFIAISA